LGKEYLKQHTIVDFTTRELKKELVKGGPHREGNGGKGRSSQKKSAPGDKQKRKKNLETSNVYLGGQGERRKKKIRSKGTGRYYLRK